MDVNFRKIDIDQFDEDVLLETELYDADPRDPAQVTEEAKARAATVRGSLSKSVARIFQVYIREWSYKSRM